MVTWLKLCFVYYAKCDEAVHFLVQNLINHMLTHELWLHWIMIVLLEYINIFFVHIAKVVLIFDW